MIAYVTLGTNDLPRAARFYDELLTSLGAKRIWEAERSVGWGTSPTAAAISIIKPYNGEAATAGNGTMVALAARSQAEVDAVYRRALELGGKDEGPAGPRGSGFYVGYFRDLDGNKLAVFFAGGAS